MPAPQGRDLDATRAQLCRWFEARLPDASEVEVGEVSGPGATGFSSDTLLFDLAWREGGEHRERSLVARLQPTGFQVFPEYDLPRQYRVMAALADSPVPVPRMLWEERDPEALGTPFYVMERIDGRTPSDNPPYMTTGWVTELDDAGRRALWTGYLDQLSHIQALEPGALDLSFLAMPELGETPVLQEVRYYEDYYRWAFGDESHPHLDVSLPWLRANAPKDEGEPRLCWGDARIGNMIFDARGTDVLAVIDWEMARLGNPEMDLAWGLFLQRFGSEGLGAPLLPGFVERSETLELYEQKTGRTTGNVLYYEILAGARFSVIMGRIGKQMKHYEVLPEEVPFETENPVSQLHGRQLEEIGLR